MPSIEAEWWQLAVLKRLQSHQMPFYGSYTSHVRSNDSVHRRVVSGSTQTIKRMCDASQQASGIHISNLIVGFKGLPVMVPMKLASCRCWTMRRCGRLWWCRVGATDVVWKLSLTVSSVRAQRNGKALLGEMMKCSAVVELNLIYFAVNIPKIFNLIIFNEIIYIKSSWTSDL